MYLPAFSFTLIGHNFFEKIASVKQINTFLEGVTASVVGLIAITALQLLKVRGGREWKDNSGQKCDYGQKKKKKKERNLKEKKRKN